MRNKTMMMMMMMMISHIDTRLRSTSRADFIVLRFNRHLAFSVAAPSAWNQLPANIRNCSTLATSLTKLKAHLFTVSFSH